MKKIILAILMVAPLSIMAQSKFAHFNSADILPNMKEYTTAQAEIQNMEKQFADDLKLMQDEMQKKYEDYQKEAANLLENVRARREQELNDLVLLMLEDEENEKDIYCFCCDDCSSIMLPGASGGLWCRPDQHRCRS